MCVLVKLLLPVNVLFVSSAGKVWVWANIAQDNDNDNRDHRTAVTSIFIRPYALLLIRRVKKVAQGVSPG